MQTDAELAPFIARDALAGLEFLLAGQFPDAQISCSHMAAMLRLIVDAQDAPETARHFNDCRTCEGARLRVVRDS